MTTEEILPGRYWYLEPTPDGPEDAADSLTRNRRTSNACPYTTNH